MAPFVKGCAQNRDSLFPLRSFILSPKIYTQIKVLNICTIGLSVINTSVYAMGIAEVAYCALWMVLCTTPAKFIAYKTLVYTYTGVVYFHIRG